MVYTRPLRSDELMHFGVKGMHWGIRRYQNEDGSLTPAGMRHYNRQAKKDAKEYARAKMFYGEGAGNRRKLIKATVNERSKNPYYKKQFESHLAEQDMSKHAAAARRERRGKDAKNTAGKTARGVYHLTVGDGAKVATGVAIAYGVARATGMDKKVAGWATSGFKKAAASAAAAKGRAHVARMMRQAARMHI